MSSYVTINMGLYFEILFKRHPNCELQAKNWYQRTHSNVSTLEVETKYTN